jgi:hypothetical protein
VKEIEATGGPSSPSAVRSSEDILGELLSLTRQIARSVESPPSSHSSTSKGISSDQLPDLWQELMDRIGKVSPFTRSYLLEASPLSLKGGILTSGFDSHLSDHLELVDNKKNRALFRHILKEMGYDADVQLVALPQPVGRQVE